LTVNSVVQTEPADLDRNWLRRLRRNLRNWYAKHGRDLPWRGTGDPYRIWISEIMLQQTTVVAVVPYFERFIERFPTIHELAAADEDEVLRCWEGLGYYSRARNIHKTARLIACDHAGRFPSDHRLLMKFPGIGRYTAGAIVSFAFDRPAPIVEANTLRLYCRLLGFAGDPRSTAGQRLLWNFAERVVPCQQPGRFNQALMDLGATVCTSAEPACGRCPLQSCCVAFADGSQTTIPVGAVRPQTTYLTEAAVAICHKGQYLLRRRGDGQRWAGLWDFIRFPLADKFTASGKLTPRSSQRRHERVAIAKQIPARTRRELTAQIAAETGLDVTLGPLLADIRHSVTRYRIRLLCFRAESRGRLPTVEPPLRWVDIGELNDLPLSVTGRKLAEMLAASGWR
jgi:A/G-specific adenine glycosylase